MLISLKGLKVTSGLCSSIVHVRSVTGVLNYDTNLIPYKMCGVILIVAYQILHSLGSSIYPICCCFTVTINNSYNMSTDLFHSRYLNLTQVLLITLQRCLILFKCPERPFSRKTFLTCHIRKSTGAIHNMNHRWIPLTWAGFPFLCMLAGLLGHTKMEQSHR